jgi:hypothetical protein
MTDMKSDVKLLNYVKSNIAYENKMVEDNENNNKLTPNVNNKPQEYPEVPEEAIVKPEDERPVKTSITPEETTGEAISNTDESEGSSSTDMDGDGSPDWDKSI